MTIMKEQETYIHSDDMETLNNNISTKQTRQKLPVNLESEQNAFRLLDNLYKHEVQQRGGCLINDYKENLQKVAHWLIKSSKRGLLLTGTMGNGKTTTLTCIKRLFGWKAKIVDSDEIYNLCKANNGILPNFSEPILLIDDLGTEPSRCTIYGDDYYPLAKLISHRYRMMLTTIIATNLRMEEIEERYGPRVVDRMEEEYDAIIYSRVSYRKYKA